MASRAKFLQKFAKFAKPMLGTALFLVGLFDMTGMDRQVESIVLNLMADWFISLTTRY